MEKTLNILNIEDSEADFLLVERHLHQQGLPARCVRVDNSADLEQALDAGQWDLILSDFSVPRMDFHESFAYLQARIPELPVILVSGSIGEEQAVELLKKGIWDFVLKDNLTRLVPAIQRSLREAADRKARLDAERAMRDSEYRFRSIFNNSPIAIGLGRRDDGRLVEVNDAWLQLYGFERHEVIGSTTADLNLYVFPDERDEIVRIISEYGQVINREIQLRRKAGDVIVVQYSAEIIALGEESFLQVMMTDITEQKRMETELRRSEELYRSLFGNMLNGFAYCRMIFDGETPQDFIYLSVNDAFEKQTGLKNVAGRRVSEVIPGIRESDPVLFETYGRVAMTGKPEQFEIYVEALKEWFWVSLYSPAREHFVAVFDVITERKQAEKELIHKNAEIEQFLYTVSHDLRSPLVTVKTFLGYLENDINDNNPERVSQDLQFIHGAADKMVMLLNELLEMSRIGRVTTTPVRLALVDVFYEVLDALAGDINERMVDIRMPDTDQILFVDHSHLFHICQNLIENAIKYSRAGSIPRIELGVQQVRGETVFFVRDNGVGIDPPFHLKIFGLFEKLDPKTPGAGLGLSMVERIVEKYGGRVWVESEGSGRGSCFSFTLPQALVKTEQQQPAKEKIHV